MKKSKDIKTKINELKEDYLNAAREEFSKEFKSLFDKYPRLKSVGWRQYTDYFNDGDECSFSVHNDEPDINGFRSNDEDDSSENLWLRYKRETGWGNNKKTNPNFEIEVQIIIYAVRQLLAQFDDDTYKNLFEDHAEVVVTRTGIDISKYTNHD